MASTTRVEKLKYKEIMTPAWRELVVTNQENATPDAKVTSQLLLLYHVVYTEYQYNDWDYS